jgi:hypothetical protein
LLQAPGNVNRRDAALCCAVLRETLLRSLGGLPTP